MERHTSNFTVCLGSGASYGTQGYVVLSQNYHYPKLQCVYVNCLHCIQQENPLLLTMVHLIKP